MKNFLMMIIPRWIIDTVVLEDTGDRLEIVCSYIDVQPGELFDAMCELKTFTWLNWSFPYGEPLNVREFSPKVEL